MPQLKTKPLRMIKRADGAEQPAFDSPLGKAPGVPKAAHQPHGQHPLRSPGRFNHRITLGHGQRHRLLDEHVDVCFEQGNGCRGVQVVGQADDGGINLDAGIGQIAVVVEHGGYVEALGQLPCPLLVALD